MAQIEGVGVSLEDELRAEIERLKMAFGEFAYCTGQAEGVWFVGRGTDTEKIAI